MHDAQYPTSNLSILKVYMQVLFFLFFKIILLHFDLPVIFAEIIIHRRPLWLCFWRRRLCSFYNVGCRTHCPIKRLGHSIQIRLNSQISCLIDAAKPGYLQLAHRVVSLLVGEGVPSTIFCDDVIANQPFVAQGRRCFIVRDLPNVPLENTIDVSKFITHVSKYICRGHCAWVAPSAK